MADITDPAQRVEHTWTLFPLFPVANEFHSEYFPSDRHAAVDGEQLAGNEATLIARQIDAQGCDFFRRAEAHHGLARNEHVIGRVIPADLFAQGRDSLLQGW